MLYKPCHLSDRAATSARLLQGTPPPLIVVLADLDTATAGKKTKQKNQNNTEIQNKDGWVNEHC